jgi:hypothetical protein
LQDAAVRSVLVIAGGGERSRRNDALVCHPPPEPLLQRRARHLEPMSRLFGVPRQPERHELQGRTFDLRQAPGVVNNQARSSSVKHSS